MLLDTEVGLGPGDIVLDGDPASHGKAHSDRRHFSAHFALARSPISATAELLYSLSESTTCKSFIAIHRRGATLCQLCIKSFALAGRSLAVVDQVLSTADRSRYRSVGLMQLWTTSCV